MNVTGLLFVIVRKIRLWPARVAARSMSADRVIVRVYQSKLVFLLIINRHTTSVTSIDNGNDQVP